MAQFLDTICYPYILILTQEDVSQSVIMVPFLSCAVGCPKLFQHSRNISVVSPLLMAQRLNAVMDLIVRVRLQASNSWRMSGRLLPLLVCSIECRTFLLVLADMLWRISSRGESFLWTKLGFVQTQDSSKTALTFIHLKRMIKKARTFFTWSG